MGLRPRASVVMATCVAVSVLSWSTLRQIVWCIRTGKSEHLFRRCGLWLK
jgi:hypothetical protein